MPPASKKKENRKELKTPTGIRRFWSVPSDPDISMGLYSFTITGVIELKIPMQNP